MDCHQADAAEQAAWRASGKRVLNGIFWVLRSGAPWRDLPESFGPYTTCYNRFVRWRKVGVWEQIMNALAADHDAAQFGRAVFQQDQTMSKGRNALRQARGELPRLHPAGVNQDMAPR